MADDTYPEVVPGGFDEPAAADAIANIDLIEITRAQVAEIQGRLDAAHATIPPLEAELADAVARLAALGG